jgi:uncharacterized membrane protein
MTGELIHPLTVIAATGTGLIAGFFFAFSACVMRTLARLPPPQGIAVMQSINITVINPLFLSLFFGTALACTCLTVFSLLDRQGSGTGLLLAGSLFYLLGAIVVTALFNIPRNERLAAVDPHSDEGARIWSAYLREWTAWNHVRTVASAAAALALILH